jgi:hypothetical protein
LIKNKSRIKQKRGAVPVIERKKKRGRVRADQDRSEYVWQLRIEGTGLQPRAEGERGKGIAEKQCTAVLGDRPPSRFGGDDDDHLSHPV